MEFITSTSVLALNRRERAGKMVTTKWELRKGLSTDLPHSAADQLRRTGDVESALSI